MPERFCTHCQRHKKTVEKGKMVLRGNQLKFVCESCLIQMRKNRQVLKTS